MYTTRKIHGGFIGSLVLVAAVVLFVFHTRPMQSRINELSAQADALQKSILSLKGETTDQNAVGKLSEVDQKELLGAIPAKMEQDVIINDLNKIASSANVDFSALMFSVDNSGTLGVINVSAGFQGTNSNIVDFLKKIETNARKFSLKETSFSQTENGEGLPIVNLNLTLQAFYRRGEPAGLAIK